MKNQERNTPKSDVWKETISLINGFGDSYTHPTGLTVNECLREHRDLARLISNGVGSKEGETQSDRDAELEGCVTIDDWKVIFEFYTELTEQVAKILKTIENEGGDIYFLRGIRARQKEIKETLKTCERLRNQ